MWDNACYIEALDILKAFKVNENLPIRIIENFYKFIYVSFVLFYFPHFKNETI
jgi:hypothetical protein